jgi:hypothetical protein
VVEHSPYKREAGGSNPPAPTRLEREALTERIGPRPLRKLSAADVRSALGGQLPTRSLMITHNCLVRAVRHAEADHLVGRNVAP